MDSIQALDAGRVSLPAQLPLSLIQGAAALSAGAASRVPLDPFTGLPLISPRVQFEMVAARALFEWHLLAIAGIRGQEAAAISFSATTTASITVVEALLAGSAFPEARAAGEASSPFAAGLGGATPSLLELLLAYFSPAASALRIVEYGLGILGGTAGAPGAADRAAARDALVPAIAQGSRAAGAQAPEGIIVLVDWTETFSLSLLDLYVERGGLGGRESLSLSSLEIATSSSGTFLAAGLPPGAYTPIDLYA